MFHTQVFWLRRLRLNPLKPFALPHGCPGERVGLRGQGRTSLSNGRAPLATPNWYPGSPRDRRPWARTEAGRPGRLEFLSSKGGYGDSKQAEEHRNKPRAQAEEFRQKTRPPNSDRLGSCCSSWS